MHLAGGRDTGLYAARRLLFSASKSWFTVDTLYLGTWTLSASALVKEARYQIQENLQEIPEKRG